MTLISVVQNDFAVITHVHSLSRNFILNFKCTLYTKVINFAG